MKKPMTRWKAAAIHLLISIVVITAVGLGLMFVWYGPELFSLMGAERLLIILAVVDITIGPLLTLIVYRRGKKSLAFDLTVIALLQVAFLAYGMYIMWQSRPVFLVAVLDRFELVFAHQLSDEDLAKGSNEGFRTRSLTGPRIIGGQLARNSKERLDLALSGMAGKDIHLLPDRYIPYAEVAGEVALKGRPLRELYLLVDGAEAAAKKVLAKSGHDETNAVYVPITSERGSATMLLEAGTGAVIGIVPVDPWPADKK